MVMAADSSLLAQRNPVSDPDEVVASAGASAFYGPLAAAMERIVGLAAILASALVPVRVFLCAARLLFF